MFKVYLTNNTESQFLKEMHNCRVRNGKVSKVIKVEIKNEFKDLKEKSIDSCSCIEFYTKDDVFIDCTKFNCVGGTKCSCCDKSDCQDKEFAVRNTKYDLTVTREGIEFSQKSL